MKDISVEQLANIIGTPVDKIILQMKEAGLGQSSPTDLVTDEDKKLSFKIIRTDSLNFKFGGSATPVPDSLSLIHISEPTRPY